MIAIDCRGVHESGSIARNGTNVLFSEGEMGRLFFRKIPQCPSVAVEFRSFCDNDGVQLPLLQAGPVSGMFDVLNALDDAMPGSSTNPVRSVRIAAVLPAEAEHANRLLEGAIAYAEEAVDVELLPRPYIRGRRDPLPRGKPDFDGALVWLRPQDDWVRHLLAAGVVVVNTSGDRSTEEVPTVVFSGHDVARTAVDHLASLGRRQAAYIGGAITASPALVRRVERFTAACRERGMVVEVLALGRFAGIEDCARDLRPNQRQQLNAFIRALSRPAVIWCDDDELARHVCDAVERAGLHVPDDVAVLGIGDFRVARTGQLTISSIPTPGEAVGRRAAEWIHESLRDRVPCTGVVALPSPPVRIRDSTRLTHGDDAMYREAMAWIAEHACERITVDQLIRSLPVSQRTFSRRFAELYGRTPGAEIRRVRAERAKAYLETTTLSVERIASLCGFDYASKFSTFFKRETGRTPSAHRLGPHRRRLSH